MPAGAGWNMTQAKEKILLCWPRNPHPQINKIFPSRTFEVKIPSTCGATCSEKELLSLVSDVDFLVVRRYYQITKKVIENARKLKLIQRAGLDYSNIDIRAARQAGIMVSNMPMCIDASVAEHTILLMMALSRKLIQSHQHVINGGYEEFGLKPIKTNEYKIMNNWMRLSIHHLFHQTLGIIGLGEIGKAVAKRANSLGMKVIYYKRTKLYVNEESELQVKYSDFHTLLEKSDFVTLHMPLTKQTRHLIGRKELSIMKNTAFLINTSRGGVIDENALYEALKKKEIGGAGLDVFEREPIPKNHPLLKLSNVVLTPHVGGGNGSLIYDLRRIKANMIRVMKGKKPINIVDVM